MCWQWWWATIAWAILLITTTHIPFVCQAKSVAWRFSCAVCELIWIRVQLNKRAVQIQKYYLPSDNINTASVNASTNTLDDWRWSRNAEYNTKFFSFIYRFSECDVSTYFRWILRPIFHPFQLLAFYLESIFGVITDYKTEIGGTHFRTHVIKSHENQRCYIKFLVAI